MKELEGRFGIVTGGSSGIGYAIANVLAENGAAVYVISRTGKVKDGIAPSAPGVTHLKGDVTDYDGRLGHECAFAYRGGMSPHFLYICHISYVGFENLLFFGCLALGLLGVLPQLLHLLGI